MQQIQRTAMKAPRKTRQAIVSTATFLSMIIVIMIILIITIIMIYHLDGSKALSLFRLCQRDFSDTKAGQWKRGQAGQQLLIMMMIMMEMSLKFPLF